MLKHRELEICPKMSRVSVRSAVRLRFSVNYDENRNERANDRRCVMNGFLSFQSLIYDILMIRKIFGCPNMLRISNNAKRHSFARFAK